jgi:regulatory protein
MNLLARREHSSHELRRKLLSRDYAAAVVDVALAALIAERLLSDERFVESFVRYKINSGLGPLRLRQALRDHGIANDAIEESLLDQSWRQLAVEVRQKRFGDALPDKYEERAKQMRFLQYRGFTVDQINGAMKQQDEWD